jgi:predicted Zn finger-like uncharacterized protein
VNVTCPDCRSIFRVDPAKVPLGGVRARCSVCGGVIPVSAPEFVTAVEAAATAPGMTSFAIEPARSAPLADSFPAAGAREHIAPDRTTPDSSKAEFHSDFESMPEHGAVEEPHSIVAPSPAAFAPPLVRHTPPKGPATLPPVRLTPPTAAVTPPPVPIAPPPVPLTPPPFPPPRTPFASPTAPFIPPHAPSATPPRTSFAPARPAVPPQATPPRTVATPSVGSPVGSPRPQPLVVTPAVPAAGGPPRRTPNPYLANDPSQKAKRLARALVSDMVAYLPQRREEGLKNHTLKLLFREEIKKSYEEYVDQVGKETAESTTHFQDALNDLLAAGKKIF